MLINENHEQFLTMLESVKNDFIISDQMLPPIFRNWYKFCCSVHLIKYTHLVEGHFSFYSQMLCKTINRYKILTCISRTPSFRTKEIVPKVRKIRE